jgi:Flp pilus assembly pilin Flp
MTCARQALVRFAGDCSGSNAVEYAILTFIAVAIVVAVSQLGAAVSALYVQVQNAMSSF